MTEPALAPTPNMHHDADHATSIWPGLAVCLGAAAVAYGIQTVIPGLSALLVAILLGVTVSHAVRLPQVLQPGIKVAAKRVLRIGIVLLGLQLALDDILDLGWAMLGVVVVIVAGGLLGTVLIGRLLHLPAPQALLIACGFSICGAAAVAGVEGTIEREDEDVATAIALVVVFGTLMIGIAPLALSLTSLSSHDQGLIAGGSIHEVAQVVAAGGLIGGGALSAAVVVKLARVLMLAPVVTVLGLLERRRTAGTQHASDTARPPLVPLFVAGFLAAALLRTFAPMPALALATGQQLQVLLLSAAMFALGLGVHVSMLRKAGIRSFALGGLSTVLVASIATGGVLLAT
ncbi:MAG: putative sulfate exporter family transporter [Ornithinimicrobium sp.]|uniref:YeiH family protein n=1 Tax=Ornithinimicrobium sp. TaxID=1977084 RepID=UPI0026DF6E31|nr:putative sulfate exporter family transporter [Ornithinimicrobium sp.]MDO5738625.1 putative sulfate exporter family transporter [Ornithinimicrobium sp.]